MDEFEGILHVKNADSGDKPSFDCTWRVQVQVHDTLTRSLAMLHNRCANLEAQDCFLKEDGNEDSNEGT
jgi:hypothetical protein